MPGSRHCVEAREEIHVGVEGGLSFREIAGRLGRSPSTICREVARNGGRCGCRAARAQERADGEARRPKSFRLVAAPVLAAEAEEPMMSTRYSPQTCVRILAGAVWTDQNTTPSSTQRR